jgi:FkbM family methyltransferase
MANVADALGLGRSLLIYYGRPWRRGELERFYAGFLAPGDLAFDIGAHVGSRTRALQRIGARVVALEPQPLFHWLLEKTLPTDGVVLRSEAVDAVPGKVQMQVSSRHPTVSTLSRHWMETVQSTSGFERVAWNRTYAVTATTLDELIRDHGMPRFCKIDVEGLEADILRGLSRPISWIAFEYLPAALDVAEACIDRLTALGAYRFNRVEGEETSFRHEGWLGPEQMRKAVREAAANGRSGDLYARLD